MNEDTCNVDKDIGKISELSVRFLLKSPEYIKIFVFCFGNYNVLYIFAFNIKCTFSTKPTCIDKNIN